MTWPKAEILRLLAQGQAGQAREALEKLCAQDQQDPELWHFLGIAQQTAGDSESAELSFRQALAVGSPSPYTHYNLANVLLHRGDIAGAIGAYRHALGIKPDMPEALNNLGSALIKAEQWEEACDVLRKALAAAPRSSEARANLAQVLLRQGRHADAAAEYRHALDISPNLSEVHCNLGACLLAMGAVKESMASFRRAIALQPDYARAHVSLAGALLGAGRLTEGWQEYTWNWALSGKARPLRPTSWDGQGLGGRNVFLHAEQGIGDELFFLRFAPLLKDRGAGQLAYRSALKLRTLLERCGAVDRLAGANEIPAPADAVFSVGDLPRLLGVADESQLPPSLRIAPLAARLSSVGSEMSRFGPAPYIGVTWRGGTRGMDSLLFKEVPASRLAAALRGVNARIIVLQRQPAPGEIEQFCRALGQPALDFSRLNEDLEEMLAALALMDEYVGVSNANMHLRAAAGRTASVLVPTPPEWRWMLHGKKSPWFPGFRVYRQAAGGEWQATLAELRGDLVKRTGQAGGAAA